MFALEVLFTDGASPAEMLFVRRPIAKIGASDDAHVIIEEMRTLGYDLQLSREIGRTFRCKPISTSGGAIPTILENMYDGEASLEIGNCRFHITALDIDLKLRETEPPDRAGVRVLRQGCASESPQFPAILVQGKHSVTVSFVPDQPVYVGRSGECAVRIDASEVSSKHARVGYESGQFWVEDLGSTNGTFVQGQQISGRVNVPPGVPIVISREVSLVGIVSNDQMTSRPADAAHIPDKLVVPERRYPALVTVSEDARPARVVVPLGDTVQIGRTPSSDIWLGVPHVSRNHCELTMAKTGAISLTDTSTNGTIYDDGILRKGESVSTDGRPLVMDFGGGVTVALCFDEQQEDIFRSSGGSPLAFRSAELADEYGDPGTGEDVPDTIYDAAASMVRPETFTGAPLSKLKSLYTSLSLSGRMLLVLVLTAIAVIIGLVVNMTMSMIV